MEPPVNIVPFPSQDQRAPALSPVETHAFNELGRELSARLDPAEEGNAASQTAEWLGPARATTHAVASRDRPVFDVMPVGVLVYRLERLLYANAAFLAAVGHCDLGDLAAAGGLDALYIDTATRPDDPADGIGISISSAAREATGASPLHARMTTIAWDGEDAHALICDVPDAAVTTMPSRPMADQREALRNLLDRLDRFVRPPLGVLAGEADAVTALDDIVELARIESGETKFTSANFSLNDLVERIIAAAQPDIAKARIIARTSFAPALPDVAGDPDAVTRIVVALVALALDRARAGGQIIVSTASAGRGAVVRLREAAAVQADDGVSPPDVGMIAQLSAQTELRFALLSALAKANGSRLSIKVASQSELLIELHVPPVDQESL